MEAAVVRRAALLLLVVLFAVSTAPTGSAGAECGPQPTVLFVQKGEKRRVSYWSDAGSAPPPPPADQLEPGSGDGPQPAAEGGPGPGDAGAEQQGAEETEGPRPTAPADEEATPLIVTAGDLESQTPPPLYDQQPHIVLPLAPQDEPPLSDGAAGGAASQLDGDPAGEGGEGGAEPVAPETAGQDGGGADSDEVLKSKGGASSAGPSDAMIAVEEIQGAEASSDQTQSTSEADDEIDKAQGSGDIQFDGDSVLLNVETAAGDGDLSATVDLTTFDLEGSGELQMDGGLDGVEGSGADPTAATPLAPSPADLASVVERIQTLVIGDHQEADGLDSDELLPLVQTTGSVQQLLSSLQADRAGDGDLAASASERRGVVAAPPPAAVAEAPERDRLLAVAGADGDGRAVPEDAPDGEEAGSGSGPPPELEQAESGGSPDRSGAGPALHQAAADASGTEQLTDDPALEGSGQVAESAAEDAALEAAKAGGQTDDLAPSRAEDEATGANPDRGAVPNGAYRFIQTHNGPNHAVTPVEPVWTGFAGHGPPIPSASAPAGPLWPSGGGAAPDGPPPPFPSWRQPPGPGPVPRPRPRPAWPQGLVYFPGQFRRGGRPRPTFLPQGDRGDIFRHRGGDAYRPSGGAVGGRPLPDYISVTPNPIKPVKPIGVDARKSLRHLDDHLFRFIKSQPYPFASSLLHGRPQPRSLRDARPVRDVRSAPVSCEWQIETESHLYLLVTLHNLSAPLTVDCTGAYIEVERENDGFEARWCGDRVRQSGTRPHLVFARGEVRIAVHSDVDGHLPTGFDADVEVIDLLDARQYATFRRSGLNFRRLIQEPLLPAS